MYSPCNCYARAGKIKMKQCKLVIKDYIYLQFRDYIFRNVISMFIYYLLSFITVWFIGDWFIWIFMRYVKYYNLLKPYLNHSFQGTHWGMKEEKLDQKLFAVARDYYVVLFVYGHHTAVAAELLVSIMFIYIITSIIA